MALNIPLPGVQGDVFGKALDNGAGMFARLIQPTLEREKQKQLEEHFQEQLKLSKAAAVRNASLMPYRLQELQDKHAAAQFERNMMNQLMGAESSGGDMDGAMAGGMGGGSMPGAPQPQMPTEETGQGMGAFTPEGMQQAQQALSRPQAGAPQGPQTGGANNPLLHKLMQNPMMRGWFKHKFGYDPLAPTAQTPEDKQAMALDLFRQKEKVKQDAKAGDIATNKVLTQNQSALQAIDTVMPMLDEFIKNPDKVYGQLDFSPSKKAAYEAKTGGMIDMLVAAQALPQVKESVELVKDQVRRRANETTKAYIERLKDFKKDLAARRSKSKSVVQSKRVDTEGSGDDFSHMSDDELRKIAGGG